MGRLFAEHDKGNLRYEPLTEEMVCAVARPGHPLSGMTGLTLACGLGRLDRAACGRCAAATGLT